MLTKISICVLGILEDFGIVFCVLSDLTSLNLIEVVSVFVMGTNDYWRDYFRTAKSTVFDVIEHAILVAATDYPKEFKSKRDKIAETLFSSCCETRCSGFDRVEKNNKNADVSNKVCSKVIDDDDQIETKCSNNSVISPYSSDDAEDLVDEIEEQNQLFEEIVRIKQILDNSDDETSSVLYESLRRLQLMALTVETLKESEIGKSVSRLRKHTSKDIRNLAKTLIDLWKQMVDEWVIAREAFAITAGGDDATPDSNPSGVDDEEGLPSPPLDDAFFATQPISMELTPFFDGMDDGNPPNHRRPSMNNQGITKAPHQERAFNETKMVQQVKKQEAIVKSMPKVSKPLNGMQRRVNSEVNYPQKPDKVLIQNGTCTPPQYKTNCVDDAKLEAAKRKLQQNYQQIENAKRQRTIQVMEINDLPKQGLGHKNAYVKSSVQSRNRMNGRH